MKITLIQLNSKPNKLANLEWVESLFAKVAESEQPDLIALPETFNFVGGEKEDRKLSAEQFDAADAITYKYLQNLARRYQVAIHAGSIRELFNGKYYNTTLVFSPDGNELARYRKIHLFDVVTPDGTAYRESELFTPGETLMTYPFQNATVGCTICYDLRFAELFLALSHMGSEIIFVPSAFTYETGQVHWEVLLRARAIETQCYIVAPNQTGSYKDGSETKQYWGHSMIVDPWGHVIAQLKDEVGFISANIDLTYLKQVRSRMPVQNHRRLKAKFS